MINTPQAPYFDDFNVEKNFLKILFKPKLSVQTRELEQIQSMFQNQIETLASQIFKNGSVVSGGKFYFKDKVNYVKLDSEYNSQTFNYDIYKNRYVCGLTNNITARIFNGWNQNTTDTASIYVDYLNSGTNQVQTFQPDEVIQLVSRAYLSLLSGNVNIGDTLQGLDPEGGATAKVININNNEYEVLYTSNNTFLTGEQIVDQETSANLVFNSGESIIYKAKVKSLSDDPAPVGFGTAVYVDAGIYYIDGYFVYTGNQSKVISPYSTYTNARVGFEKEVVIITSDEDTSLLDNAGGYPNYNAPGADRLKINLVLNYYNLYETPSENFVEIITIENTVVTGNSSLDKKYSEIIDTMARRTYDESGNYTVKPFLIDIREFLDDGTNNGIYKPEYFGYDTQQEAVNAGIQVFNLQDPVPTHIYGIKYYPYSTHEDYLEACENRLAIGVEPGKAYVMGYEIDQIAKEWFPVLKARDTKVLNNSSTSIFYGNYIQVNNITGLPNIFEHQLVQLSTDETFTADTNIIGTARIYAFEVDSGVPGNPNCVYRVYLENINMTSGEFSTDVKSIGYQSSFSAKTIMQNGTIQFNNINNNTLIFPFEKDMISSVSDASYDYKKVFNGTVTANADLSAGQFTLPVDAYSRFVNTQDDKNYLITILSGTLAGTIINISDTIVTREASGYLTISGLDQNTIGQSYMVIATLHRSSDNIKMKTLHTNTEFITSSGSYNEIVLNHIDGYRLVGVYDSGDPDVVPTTNSTNITENYDFDNGQRDTYYDLARVILKEGVIAPVGQVLVVYDYFSHGPGDYFTVDSYADIDYTDIPAYTNETGVYELKNCIDLRGRVDENGSGSFTSLDLPCLLQNNNIFESDLEYYLPRLDLLELDYRGNFNIKYGTSSDDPQYQIGSINSMTLYYLAMPAYTERPEDVVRIYCENKRYTMRDIGNLDDRITAVENYIMMNGQEGDTNNLQIYDPNGYQCIKTGFIVDIFINHDYGDDTANGYRCSVDPDSGVLRPDYKLNVLQLEKSNTRQSTVVEESGMYMIPYTSKSYISNSVNTSIIALNTNKLVEWEGNVVLNTTLSTVYNNNGITSINYGYPTTLRPNASVYNRVGYSWIGQNTLF